MQVLKFVSFCLGFQSNMLYISYQFNKLVIAQLHILAIPGIQGIISCSLGRPGGLGNCKILHKFQDQEFREVLCDLSESILLGLD